MDESSLFLVTGQAKWRHPAHASMTHHCLQEKVLPKYVKVQRSLWVRTPHSYTTYSNYFFVYLLFSILLEYLNTHGKSWVDYLNTFPQKMIFEGCLFLIFSALKYYYFWNTITCIILTSTHLIDFYFIIFAE